MAASNTLKEKMLMFAIGSVSLPNQYGSTVYDISTVSTEARKKHRLMELY